MGGTAGRAYGPSGGGAPLRRVTCRDSLRQSHICLGWNLLSFLLAGGQLVALVMKPRSALKSKWFVATDCLLVATLVLDLAVECSAQGARAFICCCERATSTAAAVANATQCIGVLISLFVIPTVSVSIDASGTEDDKLVVLSLLLLVLRCGIYLILFGLAQVRGFQLQGGMSSAAEWDIVFNDTTESGSSSARRGNYGAVSTQASGER